MVLISELRYQAEKLGVPNYQNMSKKELCAELRKYNLNYANCESRIIEKRSTPLKKEPSPPKSPRPILKRRTRSPTRRVSPKKRISFGRGTKSRSRSPSRPPLIKTNEREKIKPRKINSFLMKYMLHMDFPLEQLRKRIPQNVRDTVVIPKSCINIKVGRVEKICSPHPEGFTFMELLEYIWVERYNSLRLREKPYLRYILYINHQYYEPVWVDVHEFSST